MDIRAPLSGVLVPLAEVPDSVFARKLVGDGAAIDPTSSEVRAPIAGTVTQLHAAHHAIAVTSAEGVEVLVHVGLDTVQLKGKYFTSLVALSDQVTLGQPLLRFDADGVARAARSLLTIVIVTNQTVDQVLSMVATPLVAAGTSVLFTLTDPVVKAAPAAPVAGVVQRSVAIVLPNPNGLHARPAAVIAQRAKRFSSTVSLTRGNARANAKSVMALMGLSTRQGDEVVIEASGADAAEAIEALTRVLRDGSGEAGAVNHPPLAGLPAVPAPARRAVADGVFTGVCAAPGLALGRVVRLRPSVRAVVEAGDGRDQEKAKLVEALKVTAQELEALAVGDDTRAEILRVQGELLDDPALVARVDEGLAAGKSAAFSWQRAFTEQAAALERLDQPLLRERAVDVRDVGDRLLRRLAGEVASTQVLPEDAIVISEELTPSQIAGFPPARLKGVVSTTGSSTSHVAILVRGLGIPAVCGADLGVLELADGTEVVIDGTRGELSRAPAPSDLAARASLQEAIAQQALERERERHAALAVAQTRDGKRIEVVANIKDANDAKEAIAAGAEGVGLLRSEFMFFDRDSAPSEDEQAFAYRAIAQTIGKGRPLVVRTLDVGGDKPLPYLPLPKEGNPFLGMRGIRVSLDHPEMFRAQLRAILKAAELTDLHVMFPMISGLEEVRAAKALLAEEQRGTGAQVKVGIMIEVPSAVALSEQLAREVDFFSIGTNDLTQYTLAMDRGHPQLAKRADALHPAVVKMIALTVQGARAHRKPVHVCGGIASDPLATPLLVGLGVTELSVSIPAVGAVKACLARWSMAECVALAEEVLTLTTTAEVRALLASQQAGPTTRQVLNLPSSRAVAQG